MTSFLKVRFVVIPPPPIPPNLNINSDFVFYFRYQRDALDDNEEKKVPGTSRKQEEELEKGDDLVGAKEKMLEGKVELELEQIRLELPQQ